MSVTVLVGNPKPKSRTWQAAHLLAEKLTGAPADHDIDLVTFGAALLDWTDPRVAEAVQTVLDSRLVIVASPTYKGAYTGLLKLFLDRFGAGSLAGTQAVALMLGAHWRHALAPEVFLKPVLAEIGASCPTRGLYLLDSDWFSPSATSDWLDVARPQLGLAEVPA